MGRIFAILLIVCSIWAGLEVYQEGTSRAFGGAFAFLGGSGEGQEDVDERSVPQRAGDAYRSAHDEADARREHLLGD